MTCPKCSSRFLRADEDGDIECATCGYVSVSKERVFNLKGEAGITQQVINHEQGREHIPYQHEAIGVGGEANNRLSGQKHLREEENTLEQSTPPASLPNHEQKEREMPKKRDYEPLRAQIVADSKTMGISKAFEKSGVSLGGVAQKLKTQWPEIAAMCKPRKQNKYKASGTSAPVIPVTKPELKLSEFVKLPIEERREKLKASVEKLIGSTSAPPVSPNGHLPSFPAFSEMTSDDERLKWLDVFAQLKAAELAGAR